MGAPGSGGGGGGITAIGPNIGPMTPVAGDENMGGGTGGGLAQNAKNMARKAASQPPTQNETGDGSE